MSTFNQINNNNNNYFTSTTGAYSSNTSCAVNSTPMIQQQFDQTFSTLTTPSNVMDDWLNPTNFMKQPEQDVAAFQDFFSLLPISPPLTASPVSSSGSSSVSSSTAGSPTPLQQDVVVSAEALVALFPDILNTSISVPPPRPMVPVAATAAAQQQQQPAVTRRLAPAVAPKPIAIMPKTSSMVPIAPRPSTPTTGNNSVYNGGAYNNNNKRKMMDNNDSDEVAQKRQKNTDAARRSRLKKIVKMESLEKQVNELESDNSRLTTRVAVLESEKSALVEKDKGLEDRIRILEAQLAEAHRALTCKSS